MAKDNYETEQDNLMREMIKKEMLERIESRINDDDKEVINALKKMLADEEISKMKF